MKRLKGKVVLVTGGAGGIGLAVAERCASEGADVIIADLNSGAAEEQASRLQSNGLSAGAVECDVTDPASIRHLIDWAGREYKRIDVLVNNAGVVEVQPIFNIERSNWDRVFDVNVKGLFFVLQAVARHMVDRKVRGSIINLASEAGQKAHEMVIAYSATKSAVISITQSTALALIQHGIRVNAVSPGVVDTGMWDEIDRQFVRWLGVKPGETKSLTEGEVPYGRFGKPGDLTGIVVFLASADSEYMIGQTVNVDGGRVMK